MSSAANASTVTIEPLLPGAELVVVAVTGVLGPVVAVVVVGPVVPTVVDVADTVDDVPVGITGGGDGTGGHPAVSVQKLSQVDTTLPFDVTKLHHLHDSA